MGTTGVTAPGIIMATTNVIIMDDILDPVPTDIITIDPTIVPITVHTTVLTTDHMLIITLLYLHSILSSFQVLASFSASRVVVNAQAGKPDGKRNVIPRIRS